MTDVEKAVMRALENLHYDLPHGLGDADTEAITYPEDLDLEPEDRIFLFSVAWAHRHKLPAEVVVALSLAGGMPSP